MSQSFDKIYVGGQWRSTTATFADTNPADGSAWATIADGTASDARSAIEAAHNAFPAWAALPFNQRCHYMLKIADEIERRRDDLVKALQAEGGGWFGKGMFESGYIPEVFHAAAAETFAPIGEVLPSETNKFSTAVRRPVGVVSVISPWNFPALLTSRGFAFPARCRQYRGAETVGRNALYGWSVFSPKSVKRWACRRACSTSFPVRATTLPRWVIS